MEENIGEKAVAKPGIELYDDLERILGPFLIFFLAIMGGMVLVLLLGFAIRLLFKVLLALALVVAVVWLLRWLLALMG